MKKVSFKRKNKAKKQNSKPKKKKLNIADKTKKRIRKAAFCIFAVLLTGIPAVFLNTVYGYLPVIAVLLAILSSYGYLQILKKTIAFSELSDLSNCQRGTSVEFSVKVSNRFFLVFPKVELHFYISDLFGAEDTVTKSIITLAPKETRQFDFSVRFDHIGSYSAGIKRMKIHDFLGLFEYELKNPKEYTVDVAPRIFDVRDVDIEHNTLVENQRPMVQTILDGTDYAGVREYVWGDPIKYIHWKLSARTENYMTKQFESYGVTGLCIVIDLTAPEYESEILMTLFDSVVETALSVAAYAEDNSIEYEILYKDRKGIKKRESGGRFINYTELIADMARITAKDESFSGLDLLREECNSIYSQGNIAFCTANPSSECADLMVEIKNKRKNPLLYAVVSEHLSDEEKNELLNPLNILGGANIPYSVLTSAKELGGGEKK